MQVFKRVEFGQEKAACCWEIFPPAKVNLTLEVRETDVHGYHILHSVFHETDCRDHLILRLMPPSSGVESEVREQSKPGEWVSWPESWDGSVRLQVEGLLQSLPEQNTLRRMLAQYRACLSPAQKSQFRGWTLDLHLTKCIPSEAGLGGGSADAAGLLALLQTCYGVPLSFEEQVLCAERVGMDVPFFLKGGCALLEGTGKELRPLRSLSGQILLLAKLPQGLSTRQAFTLLDQTCISEPFCSMENERFVRTWEQGNCDWTATGNHFEAILSDLAPATLGLIHQLQGSNGCLAAHLSGSGTACWAVFASLEEAKETKKKVEAKWPSIWTHLGLLVG